jgi:hypothetical protein
MRRPRRHRPREFTDLDRRRLLLAGALWLLSALPCASQQVLQAQAQYQPITYTDDKGYRGCGIHAVVLVDGGPAGITGADVSLNVWARPTLMGIAKVAYLEARPPDIRKIAPVKFSMSREADGVPLSFPSFQPAETEGYLMAPSEPVDTNALIVSMVKGERVVVGITGKDSSTEMRYAFSGKFEPADFQTFSACLRQMTKSAE